MKVVDENKCDGVGVGFGWNRQDNNEGLEERSE